MVGLERSILPLMAEREFQLAARTAMLSFIVVFGLAKALTNYRAVRLADRSGRKHVLVAGWLVPTPVPFCADVGAHLERGTCRERSQLPPTPPNFVRIVELKQLDEFPPGDPADLEAGANRCAVR